MTYCCEDCGFLFCRVGEVTECPSCEGPRFRPATADEAKRLQNLLRKETRVKAKKYKDMEERKRCENG